MVLLELCGTHHPLYQFQTRGMQEMHDARATPLIPYNSRWPIHGEMEEVLEICLSYKSAEGHCTGSLTSQGPGDGERLCSPAAARVSTSLHFGSSKG